jgi:tetratricopeptide (TPR) repeat protein
MSVLGCIITLLAIAKFLESGVLFMSFDDFSEGSGDEFEQAMASGDAMVRGRALLNKGNELVSQHEMRLASIYLAEAWEIFTTRGAVAEAAATALPYGNSLCHEKNYELGEEVYLAGADYAKQGLDTNMEIRCLASLGWIGRRQKNFEKTSLYYGQARALALESGHYLASHLSNEYARALRKLGKFDEAAAVLKASVDDARLAGDEYPMIMHDQELASVLMQQGKYAEALEAASEALTVAEYTNDKREVQRARFNKARALNLLGRHDEALEILKKLAKAKHYQNQMKHRLRVDLEIAAAELGMEDFVGAAKQYKRLIPLLKSFGLKAEAGLAQVNLGVSYVFAENNLDAELALVDALADPSVLGREELALAHTFLAGIFAGRSDWQGVISTLRPLISDPTNQFEYWFAGEVVRLAWAYLRAGELESAAEYVALALSYEKSGAAFDSGKAYEIKAELAELAGDMVSARRFGRKAIKIHLECGVGFQAERLAKYL